MIIALSVVFAVAVLAVTALKFWLAERQIRSVARHADRVPDAFASTITLEAHRRAAAYTAAKQRLGMVNTVVGMAMLLVLTLVGGLQKIWGLVAGGFGYGLAGQVALVAGVALLLSAVDLPLDWYRQFHLEQRFGFNRMTPRLFVVDHLKGLLLAAAIGLPVASCILWLMARAGDAWWIYAWVFWIAFSLLLQVLFPVVIAPLFNRFTPLADAKALFEAIPTSRKQLRVFTRQEGGAAHVQTDRPEPALSLICDWFADRL